MGDITDWDKFHKFRSIYDKSCDKDNIRFKINASVELTFDNGLTIKNIPVLESEYYYSKFIEDKAFQIFMDIILRALSNREGKLITTIINFKDVDFLHETYSTIDVIKYLNTCDKEMELLLNILNKDITTTPKVKNISILNNILFKVTMYGNKLGIESRNSYPQHLHIDSNRILLRLTTAWLLATDKYQSTKNSLMKEVLISV
jgi:hypothetical protein